MGNFYVNYTLRGPGQQQIAEALAGRNAAVTPVQTGYAVVFDEESDTQDTEAIAELATLLSRQFQCPLLAVLNHDDDILLYWLYENGELTDEYNSNPGYFDGDEDRMKPAGGDAERLVRVFNAGTPVEVESILRKSFDEYTFAFQRHDDLARALGLPEWAVGTAYQSFEYGEFPEGLTDANLIKTKTA
ncbi:MAG TPA: hypothetical protein VHH73_04270 [Verrucomicrobiae bacterium]|nr:hypothetical protein [Verrucomicrobiae bacterium]